MARTPIESVGWIPEETDSVVITTITSQSAIESVARRVTMGTDTKNIPRGATVDVEVVAKGAAYGEDVHEYDEVTLNARKVGKAVRIAEEDLDDSPINILNQKKTEWASSYARFIDNATLATTAQPGPGVPFQSVYAALSVDNTATGYTAGTNIVKTAGDLTPELLSAAVAKREDSLYYDPSREVIIASPSFKALFRDLKDGDGRYVYISGVAGASPDTLYGSPVVWSQGCRTSATATQRPVGNPILVMGNRDFLNLGVRSGPESVVIDGRDGASALTDETLLKMRARRAFVISHEDGFVIIEKTAA